LLIELPLCAASRRPLHRRVLSLFVRLRSPVRSSNALSPRAASLLSLMCVVRPRFARSQFHLPASLADDSRRGRLQSAGASHPQQRRARSRRRCSTVGAHAAALPAGPVLSPPLARPRSAQLFFICPAGAYCAVARFPLGTSFRLSPAPAGALGAAALAGASLWLLQAALPGLRGGVWSEGAEVTYRLLESAWSPLWSPPADAAAWAPLLFWAALAPAAAHELLFRGWMAQCVRSLGGPGSVLTCALLDVCFHQSTSQLLPELALGLAAGGVALKRGVAPAVTLHAAYSASALLWAAAVQSGAVLPGAPGGGAVGLALAGGAISAAALWLPPDDEVVDAAT
jgi:hypothetical protein